MTSPLRRGASRRVLSLAMAAATLPAVAIAPGAARADTSPRSAAAESEATRSPSAATRKNNVKREIRWLHRRTEHLSQTIRFKNVRDPKLRGGLGTLLQERRYWRKRFKPLRAIHRKDPRERFARWDAWMCIHKHEGPWNDPNAPYYGGLQMDLSFQRTYGGHLLRRKGTADNWTPLEQMWVAERAHRSGRGYYPWPNTARYCGLI